MALVTLQLSIVCCFRAVYSHAFWAGWYRVCWRSSPGHLPAQPGDPVERRGGQADFHAGNTIGGVLQPALHVEDLPEIFQFSSTGVPIVEAQAVPQLSAIGRGALAPLLALVVLLSGVLMTTPTRWKAQPRWRSGTRRTI